MKLKLILWLALVLSGGLSAYGSMVEFPVTPTSLEQRQFVFSISTNSTLEGVFFHVTIKTKTDVMPPDSGVGFSSIVTSTNGARSTGLLKNEPQVTLHKDDHVWKADFIASNELLKNPDAFFVFEVPAYATINGKSIPMPAVDMYVIKLQDFSGNQSTITSMARSKSEEIIEQMRGFSMQLNGNGGRFDDGTIDPREQRKQEIINQLRMIGKEAVPVLIHALKDPDVQMRRNAELVMISLAGAYDGEPKVDIREAIPALIEATEDGDSEVRGWAAHALAEIGPDAKDAVPALIKLINDPAEGPRNTSCMALGDIGPVAKDALPALQYALNDSSKDVRKFAKQAIEKIQNQ